MANQDFSKLEASTTPMFAAISVLFVAQAPTPEPVSDQETERVFHDAAVADGLLARFASAEGIHMLSFPPRA